MLLHTMKRACACQDSSLNLIENVLVPIKTKMMCLNNSK